MKILFPFQCFVLLSLVLINTSWAQANKCPKKTDEKFAIDAINFAFSKKIIRKKNENKYSRYLLVDIVHEKGKCLVLISNLDLPNSDLASRRMNTYLAFDASMGKNLNNFEMVVYDQSRRAFSLFEKAFNLGPDFKLTGAFSAYLRGYVAELSGKSAINALKAFKIGRTRNIHGFRAKIVAGEDRFVKNRHWRVVDAEFVTDRGLINETDDIYSEQIDNEGFLTYFEGANRTQTSAGPGFIVQPWSGTLHFMVENGKPKTFNGKTPKENHCAEIRNYYPPESYNRNVLTPAFRTECRRQHQWNEAYKFSTELFSFLNTSTDGALEVCMLEYCGL